MQTLLNILKENLAKYQSEYKSLKEIQDRLLDELSEIHKKRLEFIDYNKVLLDEINKLNQELEVIDPGKTQKEDRKLLEDLAKIEELTEDIRNHNIGISQIKKVIVLLQKEMVNAGDSVRKRNQEIIADQNQIISRATILIEEKTKKLQELEDETKGKCPLGVKFKRLCALRDNLLEREKIRTELGNEYNEIDTQATEFALKLDSLATTITTIEKQIAEYKEKEPENKNLETVLSFLDLVNSCLSVIGEGPIDAIEDNNIMVNTAIQCLNNSAVKELTKEWWFNTHIRTLNPDEENNIIIKDTTILAIYSLDNHSSYGITDDGYVYQYIDGYPTFLFSNPIKVKCVTQPNYDMLPMNAKNLLKCSAVLDFQTKYSADGNSSAILASLYADAYATLHAEHIRHIKCNLLENHSILRRRNIIGYR